MDQAKLLAEAEYIRSLEEFQENLKKAEEMFDKNLRDPDKNEALGLPHVLPEHTINVLKQTQALSLMSSRMPNRSAIYERFGVKPDEEKK